MISQNKIKYLKSLEQKKFRTKEKKIVLDGLRLIDEAINQKMIIDCIWITENKNLSKNFLKKIEANKIQYSYEKEKELHKVSNTKNSQGILALISIDNIYNSDLYKFDNKIIILDQISDPGNLGTIIRTCAWFGINSIILTKNSADLFNYKCIRSAVGGHFHMKNIIYLSYDKINDYLKQNNFLVLCTDTYGEELNQINLNQKWALILGSEAHGINNSLNFDSRITIKGNSSMESLNVSIACGILLNQLINHY